MKELREIWTIKYDASHRFGGASLTLDHEPSKEEILSFCKKVLTNQGSVRVEKTYIYKKAKNDQEAQNL